MINSSLYKNIDFKNPLTWIATWFGLGFLKPGPGTWGTIGALPFAIIILIFAGKFALAMASILIFAIGIKASESFSNMTHTHDNSMIVIDEVVGMFITMLFIPLTPLYILLAFILFRAFDITKPWPIGWLDKRVKSALGVMIDDVLAGFMAGICAGVIRYVELSQTIG